VRAPREGMRVCAKATCTGTTPTPCPGVMHSSSMSAVAPAAAYADTVPYSAAEVAKV